MAKKYYAYYIPSNKENGICDSWNECKTKVLGIKSNYKSFPTKQEAQEWLSQFLGGNTKLTEAKANPFKKKSRKVYACFYVNENRGELFYSWEECQIMIENKKCRYKSFKTEEEATEWLNLGGKYISKKDIQANLPEGIYFDAGTGRGIGVEVRVTFKDGASILDKYLPVERINEFGNFHMPTGSTNNMGELTGIFIALKIGIKNNILNIYGDSSLVINYWSKGFIKKENVNIDTYNLAMKVKKEREIFENMGGKIEHISGDFNPADLGFHK